MKDPGHFGDWTVGDITTAAYNVGVAHGAAACTGLVLMAMAITAREEQLAWEAWEKADNEANREMEARYEEALRRDREAWRYVRDDD